MKTLISNVTKIYRLYHFYSSPDRLVIRRTIKRFFITQPPCSRILEVGGGNGMMRRVIEPVCRPEKFISSDIEPSDNTDIVCDAQELPFCNGEFDLLVAIEVMEHIPNTRQFLSEISRVVKEGGYVAISVPFIYGKHDYQDFYRWTAQGLDRIFQEHNMKILILNKRGGTFFAITALIVNYINKTFSGSSTGWRARGYGKKLYFGTMTILLFPFMLLSWVTYLLDLMIDRDSANPFGFVLVAEKLSGS